MKTCPKCQSSAFDDMEMCYECMTSFSQTIDPKARAIRLQVDLADHFNYELLLGRLEGSSLSVGSAVENSVVLPVEEVAAHHMDIFYARGRVWAEDINGTVAIAAGSRLAVGPAWITLLQD